MAKDKKEKKPRPTKYAEKVALNINFAAAIQVLAEDANRKVEEKLEQSKKDSK